ncbi:MAG: hypothetical protein NTZ19_08690 [Bacteroidetes bacterium]|nr:hypothetical protein [Bacteroidota bacterium]
MATDQVIPLMEGNYTNIEAREILVNLFLTKIRFHEMKNFSSKERFGIEDVTSVKKVVDLKNSLAKINELLIGVNKSHQRITITSTIDISVSDK